MPNKIPLLMRYLDLTGTWSDREMSITFHDPKDKDRTRGIGRRSRVYECHFSMAIPEHIIIALEGRSIPERSSTGKNAEGIPKKYPVKMKKTLSAHALDQLCIRWEDMLKDVDWVLNLDKVGLQRVIFYTLDPIFDDYRDQWDKYARSGNISKIAYVWAPGYIFDSEYRYDEKQNLVSRYNEPRFYDLKFVKWTQEREDFFRSLAEAFETLASRITTFESSLTEKKLDGMIAGNYRLLSE